MAPDMATLDPSFARPTASLTAEPAMMNSRSWVQSRQKLSPLLWTSNFTILPSCRAASESTLTFRPRNSGGIAIVPGLTSIGISPLIEGRHRKSTFVVMSPPFCDVKLCPVTLSNFLKPAHRPRESKHHTSPPQTDTHRVFPRLPDGGKSPFRAGPRPRQYT